MSKTIEYDTDDDRSPLIRLYYVKIHVSIQEHERFSLLALKKQTVML